MSVSADIYPPLMKTHSARPLVGVKRSVHQSLQTVPEVLDQGRGSPRSWTRDGDGGGSLTSAASACPEHGSAEGDAAGGRDAVLLQLGRFSSVFRWFFFLFIGFFSGVFFFFIFQLRWWKTEFA